MLLTRNTTLARVLSDLKNILYLVKPLHFGSVPLSQKGEKQRRVSVNMPAGWYLHQLKYRCVYHDVCTVKNEVCISH